MSRRRAMDSRDRWTAGTGLLAAVVALAPLAASAAVLPEERADVQFHSYEGGGVEVTGPAVLLRKGVREDLSLAASYYHDDITGASPDVLTTASPYSEQRDEYGFGVDYLYRNSIMSLNYLNSSESDYDSQTFSLGVAHEVFGGLTTLRMGVGRGDDTVGRSDDATFDESIDRFNYTLGIAQVLTRSLLMNVDYEAITDEGFLGNPYRFKRVLGAVAGEEIYPETRTSNALSLRARKAWSPEVSTLFGYRYFWDSWDVRAHTWEAEYTSKLQNGWLVDLYYRFYTQERAAFYSDNFAEELTFMARDKELSTYASSTVGARLSYPLFTRSGRLSRGTLNFAYEIIEYDYDNYTDASRADDDPYSFSADSLQLFFSVWY